MKKVVAFVPIKLNSQRLKNKNILPINGKPMCYYILETLSKSCLIDEVYVFCSDEKIIQYIPDTVKFIQRDASLDGDMVKGHEIYDAFIKKVHADIYILAHTTSPFLKIESIENALQRVIEGVNDSAFSAKKIQTFSWFKGLPINYCLDNIPRTQDIEPIFVETSGFYIFSKELFVNDHRRIGYKPYIQIVDYAEAVDIDEKEDYELALNIAEAIERKKNV